MLSVGDQKRPAAHLRRHFRPSPQSVFMGHLLTWCSEAVSAEAAPLGILSEASCQGLWPQTGAAGPILDISPAEVHGSLAPQAQTGVPVSILGALSQALRGAAASSPH